MKARHQSIPSSKRGSALLAALCFCAVLGIALGSYMGVCYQTLQASHRNTQSTHAAQLAETGLEEALWALNKSDWTGWTLNHTSSPRVATKTLNGFSFGNGITGAADLTIENYDGSALGNRTLKVSGTTTLADGSTITRKVQSVAKRAPLFVNAVAATGTSSTQIDGPPQQPTGVYFTGDGTVKSFDSTNPGLGSGYSAVVSSASRVRLTNVLVDGYVAATDGLSGYSYLSRLSGPVTPASVLIDPARLSTSPYQPVFDLVIPSAPTTLPTGNVTIGEATVTTYFAEDVELNGAETLTIVGPVVIVVAGDFKIQGSAQIVVQGAGSLQVLMTGAAGEFLIAGDGIRNETGLPKNVAIFSAENSASAGPAISTNVAFHGVVYFPHSKCDFLISSDLDFYGSIVAKNVRITGSPNLHYDVDLQRTPPVFSGIDTPFAVSSWQEITR